MPNKKIKLVTDKETPAFSKIPRNQFEVDSHRQDTAIKIFNEAEFKLHIDSYIKNCAFLYLYYMFKIYKTSPPLENQEIKKNTFQTLLDYLNPLDYLVFCKPNVYSSSSKAESFFKHIIRKQLSTPVHENAMTNIFQVSQQGAFEICNLYSSEKKRLWTYHPALLKHIYTRLELPDNPHTPLSRPLASGLLATHPTIQTTLTPDNFIVTMHRPLYAISISGDKYIYLNEQGLIESAGIQDFSEESYVQVGACLAMLKVTFKTPLDGSTATYSKVIELYTPPTLLRQPYTTTKTFTRTDIEVLCAYLGDPGVPPKSKAIFMAKLLQEHCYLDALQGLVNALARPLDSTIRARWKSIFSLLIVMGLYIIQDIKRIKQIQFTDITFHLDSIAQDSTPYLYKEFQQYSQQMVHAPWKFLDADSSPRARASQNKFTSHAIQAYIFARCLLSNSAAAISPVEVCNFIYLYYIYHSTPLEYRTLLQKLGAIETLTLVDASDPILKDLSKLQADLPNRFKTLLSALVPDANTLTILLNHPITKRKSLIDSTAPILSQSRLQTIDLLTKSLENSAHNLQVLNYLLKNPDWGQFTQSPFYALITKRDHNRYRFVLAVILHDSHKAEKLYKKIKSKIKLQSIATLLAYYFKNEDEALGAGPDTNPDHHPLQTILCQANRIASPKLAALSDTLTALTQPSSAPRSTITPSPLDPCKSGMMLMQDIKQSTATLSRDTLQDEHKILFDLHQISLCMKKSSSPPYADISELKAPITFTPDKAQQHQAIVLLTAFKMNKPLLAWRIIAESVPLTTDVLDALQNLTNPTDQPQETAYIYHCLKTHFEPWHRKLKDTKAFVEASAKLACLHTATRKSIIARNRPGSSANPTAPQALALLYAKQLAPSTDIPPSLELLHQLAQDDHSSVLSWQEQHEHAELSPWSDLQDISSGINDLFNPYLINTAYPDMLKQINQAAILITCTNSYASLIRLLHHLTNPLQHMLSIPTADWPSNSQILLPILKKICNKEFMTSHRLLIKAHENITSMCSTNDETGSVCTNQWHHAALRIEWVLHHFKVQNRDSFTDKLDKLLNPHRELIPDLEMEKQIFHLYWNIKEKQYPSVARQLSELDPGLISQVQARLIHQFEAVDESDLSAKLPELTATLDEALNQPYANQPYNTQQLSQALATRALTDPVTRERLAQLSKNNFFRHTYQPALRACHPCPGTSLFIRETMYPLIHSEQFIVPKSFAAHSLEIAYSDYLQSPGYLLSLLIFPQLFLESLLPFLVPAAQSTLYKRAFIMAFTTIKKRFKPKPSISSTLYMCELARRYLTQHIAKTKSFHVTISSEDGGCESKRYALQPET